MTGKEFLTSKTEEDMYDTMFWLFNTYGISFTDSRSAIIEWLKRENATDKTTFSYNGKDYII